MGESFWQRLVGRVQRLRQHPAWAPFAGHSWPDSIMSIPVTDRFHAKQGRSIGRVVFRNHDQKLVVYLKRHYRLPWWRGLLALLWPDVCWSPGLQEWNHLEWARAQGLPVPRALAAGEFIGPWGRLQSFLAVEELTGMLALHEAVPAAAAQLDPSSFRRWKRGLVRELVRLTRALHQGQWFHKDLYLCHFYIREDDIRAPITDWTGRVHMIDLHRLSRHPRSAWWWQAKDLAQLLYSSGVDGVDARDRLHFWRLYLGHRATTLSERALGLLVRMKWWSYRRHNQKKKARQRAQQKSAA